MGLLWVYCRCIGVRYLCDVELVLWLLLIVFVGLLHVSGSLVLFDLLLVAWICIATMGGLCLICFELRFAVGWYIVCFGVMVWF